MKQVQNNIKPKYILNVSSSSSEMSGSLSPKQNNKEVENKGNLRINFKEDEIKAINNLRYVINRKEAEPPVQKISKFCDSQTPDSRMRSSTFLIDKQDFEEFPKRQIEYQEDKKQINFLKGLSQNKDLSIFGKIDEYYQDNRIVVNMDTNDFMTFIRLQHEVDELKRKQDDYNQQKDKNFCLTQKQIKLSGKNKKK